MTQFRSESGVWAAQKQLWDNAANTLDELKSLYVLADSANSQLSSCSATISYSLTYSESNFSNYDNDRIELVDYCSRIHDIALDEIDYPLYCKLMQTLDKLYNVNPEDMTASYYSGSIMINISLSDMIPMVVSEEDKLSASYQNLLAQIKHADNEIPEDRICEMIIESIALHYANSYAGEMNDGGLITDFEYSQQLLIDYYEILNPENATKMNEFFKDMAADTSYDYSTDIDNIKYIAYASQEPYHSIFFTYLDKVEIGSYTESGTQHFKPSNNKIYISLDFTKGKGLDCSYGPYGTFFHEYGHAVDDLARGEGFLGMWDKKYVQVYTNSSGQTLLDVARSDVEAKLMEALNNTTLGDTLSEAQKQEFISNVMNSNTPNSSLLQQVQAEIDLTGNDNLAASDVYGGFTSNSIGGQANGGWGHSDDYWFKNNGNDKERQSTELFAEYFSASMTGNEGQIASSQEYFPEAYDFYEEMMEGLANE